MSKQEIKKIQKSIEDILGTKSGLSKKRPSVKDRDRRYFNTLLNNLQLANARSIGLKHDYKIDFIEYDEVHFNALEALMKLHFSKQQRSIIEWWLYDKFLPDGSMLILKDETTGDEIPTDTPDDVWELIQKYEEKNLK
tara:strand:+ start:806 stop:1219 length:414 start_codon:yes stop_codon:yes gene_type:complete